MTTVDSARRVSIEAPLELRSSRGGPGPVVAVGVLWLLDHIRSGTSHADAGIGIPAPSLGARGSDQRLALQGLDNARMA